MSNLANFKIQRVLITDAIESVCPTILKKEGIEVVEKKLSKAELIEAIKDFDCLIVRSATQVTAEVIAAGTRLKIIGRAGTGVDNIDTDAATQRGIIVMNTPGGNTISAAEHTVALLCSMARLIPPAANSLKSGKWDRKTFMGTELAGKTVAVIGLGRIGREVAHRCQAFGMVTIGYDPILPDEAARKCNIEPYSLDQIWPRADFITVHTPLTPETTGLLNDKTFALCKDGVRVINCARGGIIDEDALLRALQSKKCAAAALDVFVKEPPDNIAQNPLIQHPNVLATPHLGASTEEAQNKVAAEIASQIIAASQGKVISGAVNAPALTHALKPEIKPYIELGYQVGSLISQMMFANDGGASKNLKKICITTQGRLISDSSALLKSAVLSGLLTHLSSDPVNLVNSTLIAENMGLDVIEQKESALHPNFNNLLIVEYETTDKKRNYCATVFGHNKLRLVQIDDFTCEVDLRTRYILFLRNHDKPGVAGHIGTIIGESGVNIAFISLGRDEAQNTALTIVGLDSALSDEVMAKIAKVDWVLYAKLAKMF